MVFKITKTSESRFEEFKHFNTVEDLVAWCKSTGEDIVLQITDAGVELEIYDSYRE